MNYQSLAARIRTDSDTEFGTGATDAAVRAAETVLGLTLRGEYVAFLREFGWAAVGHIEIAGVGADAPFHLDLVRLTLSERTEVGLPLPSHLLPVTNDGAGNLYCLDLEGPVGEPPVVFWNHEGQPDQIPDFISDSFAAWLLDELEAMATG